MKHLCVNEELKMVENENDFSELIRENMGDDSERYFQEILEQHDNENDKVYYEMLAESRENSMIEIRNIIEGLIGYYFETPRNLNRKKILKVCKKIQSIIAKYYL